jgi:hypothetical protein
VLGLASGPALAGEEYASEPCWLPPAELANRLRRLAQDAYRVMKDRHANPSEAEELSLRIEELREHTRGSGLFEIDRWLQKASEAVSANKRS